MLVIVMTVCKVNVTVKMTEYLLLVVAPKPCFGLVRSSCLSKIPFF